MFLIRNAVQHFRNIIFVFFRCHFPLSFLPVSSLYFSAPFSIFLPFLPDSVPFTIYRLMRNLLPINGSGFSTQSQITERWEEISSRASEALVSWDNINSMKASFESIPPFFLSNAAKAFRFISYPSLSYNFLVLPMVLLSHEATACFPFSPNSIFSFSSFRIIRRTGTSGRWISKHVLSILSLIRSSIFKSDIWILLV